MSPSCLFAHLARNHGGSHSAYSQRRGGGTLALRTRQRITSFRLAVSIVVFQLRPNARSSSHWCSAARTSRSTRKSSGGAVGVCVGYQEQLSLRGNGSVPTRLQVF